MFLKAAQVVAVVAVLFCAVTMGLLVLSNLAVWSLSFSRVKEEPADLPSASVAIVLGAAPGSPILDHRLDAGVALWKAGKVKRLLVTGGTDGTGYGETEYMWRYVRKRGVPDSAITVDSFGVRTLDSVRRAKRVFGFEDVVVVTQRFHIHRSVFLARCSGLNVRGYVAAPVDSPEFRQAQMREIPARAMAVWDVATGKDARFGDQPPSFANHPAK